jgi:ParB family chromosome partitioning protein
MGVLQPVIVRAKGRTFEIVCGERRYRACKMAELKTIPAIVRKLTDDEALESAITENLQRADVSPIEEATAYKRLSETGRYDVAKLAARFGKKEAYIRNRMKLNDLTDEILTLVNDETLSISVALELCRYSADVQTDIYEKHLNGNIVLSYSDWRNLTAKDFIRRLESNYCAELSQYNFDKSECAVCPLNTNAYTLFHENENEGKCTSLICLRDRNKQFLVETCKKAIQENPEIEIVQPAYRGKTNEDVYAELTGQGYTLTEFTTRQLPTPPEFPERAQFDEQEEYDDAIEEYNTEYAEYEEHKEELENLVLAGKAKEILTVDNNRAVKCFAILPQNEVQATASANEVDTVQKIEKQDKRNKEIAVENIVEDTKKLIRESEIPQGDFTEFEDKLLYFVMLEDVKREHFSQLLGSPTENWHLNDEQKFQIINSLTEEQKTLISRDFLIKHSSNTFGIAKNRI